MARIALDALGGLHLNVERVGDGPPILAIHGFTGSVSSWEAFTSVAWDRHTVISLDLLGHGASDVSDDPELYGLERTARALAELLDHLNVRRVHWLGYSMGGRVALGAALLLHERTISLTLESASPGLATVEQRAARVASDEALADWMEDANIEAFVDYWESLPLWRSQARLPMVIRDRLRSQRLANSPRGLANSLKGIGTGAQPPLHHLLPSLQTPTLLISGDEDAKFVEIARQMHQALPGSRLCIVKESGHAVHLEQPDTFIKVVLDFIRSVEQS